MTISEKVSYIKGLCDGMKINEDKPEGRLFKEIIDVLGDIAKEISDLNENSLDLADEIDELNEDLAILEDEIYGDDEDEDDEDDDDCDCGCHDEPVFFEVKCPSCGNEITIDEDVAALGKIDCPNCGEKLELEFDEDEDDDCCCCGCEDEDEE